MLLILEYTSAALLMSPQTSAGMLDSWLSQGGVGALGKFATEHEPLVPVNALPPFWEVHTPTSYRAVAVEWNCATKETVALSPGNRQPWTPSATGSLSTTLRLVVWATLTSFAVHPPAMPEAWAKHGWSPRTVPPEVGIRQVPPAGQSAFMPHAVVGLLEQMPGSGVGVAVGAGVSVEALKNGVVTVEGNDDNDLKKLVGSLAALPPGNVV